MTISLFSKPKSYSNNLDNSNAKENILHSICLYSLFFILTSLGAYFLFLVAHYTILRINNGNFDGIGQYYPAYTSIRNYFTDIISGKDVPSWSWSIGLGDDYFEILKSKITNPLTLIYLLFPKKFLDVAYFFITILSQYLAGLFFLFFLNEVKIKSNLQILGALSYSFGGWIYFSSITQGSFVNAAMALPLMILGIDKILKGKTPIIFILSVVFFFVSGILWAYAGGIVSLIYFPLRYIHYNKSFDIGKFLKSAFFFILYGIVGLLLSSSLILAMFNAVGNAISHTGYDAYSGFYSLKMYMLSPMSLTSINKANTVYSIAFVPALVGISIPIVFLRFNKANTWAIITSLLLIASLFPITGKFFNGFSYTVGRWYFILLFFLVWSGMEILNKGIHITKKEIVIMSVWTSVLGFWNIIIVYKIFRFAEFSNVLSTLMWLIIGYLTLLFLYLKENNIVKVNIFPILSILLIINLVGTYNLNMLSSETLKSNLKNHRISGITKGNYLYYYARNGRIRELLENSPQRVVVTLEKSDPDFFRTDQIEGYSYNRAVRVQANENLYFNTKAVYGYWSTLNSSWLEFNKAMGNNAGYFDRTTSFSNDNRFPLDYLMGVKYFLGDTMVQKPGASEYANYSFSKYKDIEGVSVLKSRHNIGIGAAFSNWITEKELLSFEPLQREQVLLQSVVVPDNISKELSKIKGLKHLARTKIKTKMYDLNYTLKPVSNIEFIGNKKKTMIVKKGNGSFKLVIPESDKTKNCQLYVYFQGLHRKTNSYEDYIKLGGNPIVSDKDSDLKKKIIINDFSDWENFRITAKKNGLEKSALYRKGKNQALLDIDNFAINMGHYKNAKGDINLEIDKLGKYDFQNLHVYAVPLSHFENYANMLDKRKYRVKTLKNDFIRGTIENKETSILYLSILNNPGWKVYVDGKQTKTLSDINIAFTGAIIPKGKHIVELRYNSPNKIPAAILTSIGIILFAIIIYKKRKGRNAL